MSELKGQDLLNHWVLTLKIQASEETAKETNKDENIYRWADRGL